MIIVIGISQGIISLFKRPFTHEYMHSAMLGAFLKMWRTNKDKSFYFRSPSNHEMWTTCKRCGYDFDLRKGACDCPETKPTTIVG